MKCNQDCFNCKLPVTKCRGGPVRKIKSALPWRNSTKTTVLKWLVGWYLSVRNTQIIRSVPKGKAAAGILN